MIDDICRGEQLYCLLIFVAVISVHSEYKVVTGDPDTSCFIIFYFKQVLNYFEKIFCLFLWEVCEAAVQKEKKK